MTTQSQQLEQQISSISATAFITLFARAAESRSESPILADPLAVDLTARLRPLLARSDRKLCRQLAAGEMRPLLATTMALRARRYDAYAREFTQRYPDGVIVNLGCGLDTRFHRIDDGHIILYDLDLPEMIELKRTMLSEGPRCHFIACSVLDFQWMQVLRELGPRPFLFLAEGLFMYLPPEEVKRLILALRQNFPGSELVCEVVNNLWQREPWKSWADAKLQRQMNFDADATFQSGVDSSRTFEEWDPGICFLDEWSYFDEDNAELGLLRWLRYVPLFRKTQWTLHYRLGDRPADGSSV